MGKEILETNEKLEQIEANALDDTTEVTPLENTNESIESTECVNEPSMEMSYCTCTGGCGSNYSISSGCVCTGGCGSNYHK